MGRSQYGLDVRHSYFLSGDYSAGQLQIYPSNKSLLSLPEKRPDLHLKWNIARAYCVHPVYVDCISDTGDRGCCVSKRAR